MIRVCTYSNGVEDDSCLAVARFDTGAPHNLVSRRFVDNYLRQSITGFDAGPQPIQTLVNNNTLYAAGKIRLRWRSNEPEKTQPKFFVSDFYVIDLPNDCFDIIVGEKTCKDESIFSAPALGAAGFYTQPPKPVQSKSLLISPSSQ